MVASLKMYSNFKLSLLMISAKNVFCGLLVFVLFYVFLQFSDSDFLKFCKLLLIGVISRFSACSVA